MVDPLQPEKVFQWPPIESNPEIFTNYMRKLGMPAQWGFSEVLGFDEELLSFIPRPVLGVVCNMEFLKKQEDLQRGHPDTECAFYMKQHGTLDNACGIIAALHAILNNPDQIFFEEGSVLQTFQMQTLGLTPEEKATFLENFQEFKEEHRTYAMKGESQHALTQKDVKHHYISFVLNQRGQLVELDGRKKGPHIVQDNCADVLRGAISEIQRRLENGEYSQSCSVMTLNAAWD